MDSTATRENTRTRQRALVDEHLTALLQRMDTQGWDATTVDELAREAGMSRATFFRTFGSKEDVVFLDHETMLERLESYLSTTGHDTASALRQGLLLVFRHHLADRERTEARHRLLRQSQALRNRELLTSHRYERLFRRWLRERLGQASEMGVSTGPATVEALSASLAGAGVALHNACLRRWIRDPQDGAVDELSEQAQKLIQVMLQGYAPVVGENTRSGASGESAQRPVAVVALVGDHADREQIVEAVRKALS